MDELDLFREFRSGVREPRADAERRASARLAQAIDRRHGARTRLVGMVRQRRKGIALAPAVLAGTAAVALFATAPWSSTPGFLERAEAALAPPVGSILHFKVVLTVTSKELDCKAARPTEVWIDQTPPHRYRALIAWPPRLQPTAITPRLFVCWKANAQREIGSQAQPAEPGLEFVPPNTLRSSGSSGPRAIFSSDPVRDLRQAISQERAHDEGKTTLDGRTVERIRIDPPERTVQTTPGECLGSVCIRARLRNPVYAYVDPKTLALVQERVTQQILAGPLKHAVLVDYVERYLTFEYLPRTSANLALTSIRAQHPDATVKCTPTWLYRC